jgi:hypothetical protein
MSTSPETDKPSWIGEIGEIVKDLNLPKHVLDQVTALAKTLLGPSAKEFGELFADKVRHRRLVNQVAIFKKTSELLEQNNLKARELGLKTLVPLLEQSSLEDDQLLQDKWANLIANMASSPESGLEPKLVKTLSNLSGLEAQVLDFAFAEYKTERQGKFDRSQKSPYFSYKTIEDVKLHMVVLSFENVRTEFGLNNEFAKICVDNLVSLGLLKYEDPEIDIQDDGSEVQDEDDPDRNKAYNLELSISANYNQSDNFTLTAYGNYFLAQCNNVPATRK